MIYGFDYGFENDKFYVDFKSCSRPHGTMREEHELRAKEIAETSKKICVSLSSGVDSQSMVHSFYNMGVDFETSFLYCPGYNERELEQLQILKTKYNIEPNVVTIDVEKIRELIDEEVVSLDISVKNSILQKEYIKQLPDDYDIVQMTHDPLVWINQNDSKSFFFIGWYGPEIGRARAFDHVKRSGKTIFWANSPEFLASILDDDVFKAAVHTHKYFDGNGATVPGKCLWAEDRWDYYIKPLIYGKYWKNELEYFPKYVGTELIPDFNGNPLMRKHGVAMPYFDLINLLNSQTGETKRVYENVPFYILVPG